MIDWTLDCSFCRTLRLPSDCSFLSLDMRFSRFLCANPAYAYPHPLDLSGRPHRQCPDCPTGLLPLGPDLEAGNRQVRLSHVVLRRGGGIWRREGGGGGWFDSLVLGCFLCWLLPRLVASFLWLLPSFGCSPCCFFVVRSEGERLFGRPETPGGAALAATDRRPVG
jgi:hypothetical protein